MKNERSVIESALSKIKKFYVEGVKEYNLDINLSSNTLFSGYTCFLFLLSFSLDIEDLSCDERKRIIQRCRNYSLLYLWVDGILDNNEISKEEKKNLVNLISRTLSSQNIEGDYNHPVYLLYTSLVDNSKSRRLIGKLYKIILKSVEVQKDFTLLKQQYQNITYLKGGFSVYVAVCVIYGKERFEKQQLLQLGYCIQLLDDLMDCRNDLKDEIATLATIRIKNGKTLDKLALDLEKEIQKIEDVKYFLGLALSLNGTIIKSGLYSRKFRYQRKLTWLSLLRELNFESKEIENAFRKQF